MSPLSASRLLLLLAAVLVLNLVPPAEAAGPCTGTPVPTIFVVPPKATSGYGVEVVDTLARVFVAEISHSYATPRNRINYNSYHYVGEVLGLDTTRQQFGIAAIDYVEVAQGMGSEFVVFLKFGQVADLRVLNVDIINTGNGTVAASARETLSSDASNWPDQVTNLVRNRLGNLDCTLRDVRLRPVVPVVTLSLSPASLAPGAPLTATAVLRDGQDGLAQIGRPIDFTHLTTRGEEEPHPNVFTSFFGSAELALTAGPFVLDSKGKVRAVFRREDGLESDVVEQLYDVVRPNRNVSVQGTRPKLGPGAPDQLAIGVTRNNAPASGATVTLGASAGALGAASVVTDSQGSGSVTFTAPSRPAVVEIRASTPGATPSDPPLEDAISIVVDAGIAMSMNAKDTIVSSPSTVTVDLDRNGQALAGATVSFTLAGGGFLDAATAATDSAGRAQVSFVAPPQVGASTVTASVTVVGQTITRTTTIAYRDPRDALTREIGEVVLAVQTDPSDANLQRLLSLRSRLRSLGQDARAEQMLDQVDGELYCVHQRADDTCRSGSGLGPVRGTLDLLAGLSAGSAKLDDLAGRTRDTRRVCPYPAFMQGAVWDFAATLHPGSRASDAVTGTALLAISSWDGDEPAALFFEFTEERPNLPTNYVRGTTRPLDRTAPFTGTFVDGDVFGYYGNRFMLLDYQRNAPRATAIVSVNGPSVSGIFDLYKYTDPDNNEQLAYATMSATVLFPPAPTYRCGRLPQPPGD